ncbi:MAG: hypothetical protein BGO95_10640 [Micrococcales bacterium 73-13]|nr:MAG: hypothetical protein BGO95_10640 [Micrococcales bacterium 73-13]
MLQWALTVVFSATGLYAFLRIIVDRNRPLLIVGHALHVLMSAGMVAMCWPWWSLIPTLPQIVLFFAGAAWFAALLLLQLLRRVRRVALGGHGPWHEAAHLVMMFAMVWMTVSVGGSTAAGHANHGSALPLGASLMGIGITAALLVAAAVFLVEFIDCLRGRRTWLGHTGDVAAGAAMSLGMAAMCWPMIAG